jgi:TatD DNase family protein
MNNSSLVDFHCHLDLYPDFEKVIDECEKQRINTLSVTTTPKAWPRNNQLLKSKKFIRAALGLHPQLVAARADEIDLWDKYLDQTRYIGEVGLDAGAAYYNSFGLQQEIFAHILQSCNKAGNKILTIHSVRSAPKVLEMVSRYLTSAKCKIILHWFSGGLANAKTAIEFGSYFSLNSEMLRNPKNVELIKVIPIERVLTETDGPFVAIDDKAARPRDVEKTLIGLSTILKYSAQELRDIIFKNMEAMERAEV